jgi:glucosylglycerate synthase
MSASLPSSTEGQVRAIGTADLVVGIRSYNNATTIGHLEEIWGRVLPGPLRHTLAEAVTDDPWRFHLPDPVWAEVVYRFALAHRRREVNPEHLFASLIPLYLGRTASFVVQMQSAGPAEVEARVERLALVFEALKPLLVAEWPASDKEVSS